MQAFPFGRVTPGKSETPPCKSGQLKKDFGLEASSLKHAARSIIFDIMFYVAPQVAALTRPDPRCVGSGPIFSRFNLGFGADRYRTHDGGSRAKE